MTPAELAQGFFAGGMIGCGIVALTRFFMGRDDVMDCVLYASCSMVVSFVCMVCARWGL